MGNKYYEAYDERYKQVHKEGLSWATENNTPMVEETIYKYHLEDTNMLEIGCGEGRDARFLLHKGYNLLATDVSKEAIHFCISNDPEHKNNYAILDALSDNGNEKYGFIYSVACIHMLVLDEDRNKLYKYIYNHLKEDGYCIILSMGDGVNEQKSDITKAFNITKRIHQESNKKINVTETSCRIVNFDTFSKEAKKNQFIIIDSGMTKIEHHFNEMMYIILKRGDK